MSCYVKGRKKVEKENSNILSSWKHRYYFILKINELSSQERHGRTVNVYTERSWSEKATYCMISAI